jgi:hypothetical protein
MSINAFEYGIKACLHFSPQAEIQSKRGHHFIGIVKTSHARFPKQYLEEELKDKSDGREQSSAYRHLKRGRPCRYGL